MTEKAHRSANMGGTPENPKNDPGRDFLKVASAVRFATDRAALLQPGDYIDMPVAAVARWYMHVPEDRQAQIDQGLVGRTRVTVREIVPNEQGRVAEVILQTDKDDQETVRRPVQASLFYNYGAEFPRH